MKDTAEPGLAQAHVELRRARVLDSVSRPLRPIGADADALPPERVEFLLREAEELYWNELAWEELTDDELVAGGHLTEMVFSGFLAFIRGLLLEEARADSPVPARPHPDAVEAILVFLAERYTALSAALGAGADSERLVWDRAMTARLIDLVLYRLYGLDVEEQGEIDARA